MKCPHCGKKLPADKGRAKGGKSRWAGMSRAERSEAASRAAKARWEQIKQKKP